MGQFRVHDEGLVGGIETGFSAWFGQGVVDQALELLAGWPLHRGFVGETEIDFRSPAPPAGARRSRGGVIGRLGEPGVTPVSSASASAACHHILVDIYHRIDGSVTAMRMPRRGCRVMFCCCRIWSHSETEISSATGWAQPPRLEIVWRQSPSRNQSSPVSGPVPWKALPTSHRVDGLPSSLRRQAAGRVGHIANARGESGRLGVGGREIFTRRAISGKR